MDDTTTGTTPILTSEEGTLFANNNNNNATPTNLPAITEIDDSISNITSHHTIQSTTGGGTVSDDHTVQSRGDHGDVDVPLNFNLYAFAACAALNSANLGYDIGVNTNAVKLVQDDMGLSDVQVELFMGSLNLFSMLGAIGAQFVSDRFGRRQSFIVAAVGFIVGCLMMSIAQDYATLIIGRVTVGFGVGFGLAIDPVYISEISPASHRGMLVTWSELAINIGLLIGFSTGLIFYSAPANIAWRWMFGVGAIMPSILILLVIFVMPESPRWLVQKDMDDEARCVLAKIYPPGFDVAVVVKDIRDNITKEAEAEQATGWGVIFQPSPAFRRMLIVGIGVAISQQIVGIDAIQYFLAYILDEAGITTRGAQGVVLIFLGVIKTFAIIYAGNFFDRRGRLPLLFVSLGGMAFALVILAFNFYSGESSAAFAVFALALYLAFFSLGMGPGAWLIPSEVFSTTIRAKAMSVATFLNRATATIMASSFLSVANTITWPGFFLLLAGICVICFVFIWCFVPETKGKSLEDMTYYFAEITGDKSILDAMNVTTAPRTEGEEETSAMISAAGSTEVQTVETPGHFA